MVQWKWVIGAGLLLVLCVGVCWMVDTASGVRTAAMIREWCQSNTRAVNYQTNTYRTLPPAPPLIVDSESPPQPDDRSSLCQLKRTIPSTETAEAGGTRTHADRRPIATEQFETTVAETTSAIAIDTPKPPATLLPDVDPPTRMSQTFTPTPVAALAKPGVAASGELETKAALERLLGVPFEKVRPSWLRNPATGRNLEIDCYNAALRIAVEYQGLQHYVYPNPFHKTAEEFAGQLQRDELKKQLVEAIGITLITVPFTVKRKGIEAFLKAELANRGRIATPTTN